MGRTTERGATGLEWSGLVAVAALVVGTVFVTVQDSQVEAATTCHLGNIFGGEADCAAAAAGGGSTGSTDDRGDTQGDARGDRRDDARGDRPGPGETAPPGAVSPGGTSGPEPFPDGLGPAVIGTDAGPSPQPPVWEPSDAGGGQHASEGAGVGDRATEFAAEAAANAMAGAWPDASRTLLHCLGNSGDTLDQDVDSMLESSQNLSDAVDLGEANLAALALERAQAAGATEPVTFPINSSWRGVFMSDDDNWYYALNGIQWNLSGQVTVNPPTTPGGEWTYSMTTAVNIRDRYNWDGTKSTEIGPFTVTDEQLAELHRKGLAQEYTATGTSGTRERNG